MKKMNNPILKNCKLCDKPIKKRYNSRKYHQECFPKARSKYQVAWAKRHPEVVIRKQRKYYSTKKGQIANENTSLRHAAKASIVKKMVTGKSSSRILQDMRRQSAHHEEVLTFR